MELNECKTPFEITSWLVSNNDSTSGCWAGKRSNYVHFCSSAIEKAYKLGQQSRALPVVTVGDAVTARATEASYLDHNWKPLAGSHYLKNKANQLRVDRRKTPRGDVARGLVDAALVGGVPTPFQDAANRAAVSVCEHCGLTKCDVREID